MKKATFFFLAILGTQFVQAQKPVNLSPSNLESNIWWERYDDKTRTIHNVNLMILTDGNNSEDRTGAFKVKLYLYNAEQYTAEKKIYYIKTYEIESMKHMSAREANNQTVSFLDQDVPPNTYRLGIHVDADNEIAETNENDNTMLFKGELVVKPNANAGGGSSSSPAPQPKAEEKSADPKQQEKDEKVILDSKLENYTRTIVAKQAELSKLKKTGTAKPYQIKMIELELEELETRREETKIAQERLNLSIQDKLTANKSQELIAEEQKYKIKADDLSGERLTLSNAEKNLTIYEKQIVEFDNIYQAKQKEIVASSPQTPKETIDLNIAKEQQNEALYKREAAKVGLEKSQKMLSLTASQSEIATLSSQEADFNNKANQSAAQIKQLASEKKAIEREEKKAANKQKVDNTKVKIRLDSTKRTLAGKEKNLDKEQNKKKPNAGKIEALENEIRDLKSKVADLESQLK
ncbi:MAG: hypothetical protein ACK4K0_00615 [Flavobacteriales bacterium]